jgi:hypothetical protein
LRGFNAPREINRRQQNHSEKGQAGNAGDDSRPFARTGEGGNYDYQHQQ